MKLRTAHDLQHRAVATDGPNAHRIALFGGRSCQLLAMARTLCEVNFRLFPVRGMHGADALHKLHGMVVLAGFWVDDINIPHMYPPLKHFYALKYM